MLVTYDKNLTNSPCLKIMAIKKLMQAQKLRPVGLAETLGFFWGLINTINKIVMNFMKILKNKRSITKTSIITVKHL